MKTLIEDLLTEDRFWTFWSTDWSVAVYVAWGGQTKFKDVVDYIKNCHQFKEFNLELGGYERQVDIKIPDYRFN